MSQQRTGKRQQRTSKRQRRTSKKQRQTGKQNRLLFGLGCSGLLAVCCLASLAIYLFSPDDGGGGEAELPEPVIEIIPPEVLPSLTPLSTQAPEATSTLEGVTTTGDGEEIGTVINVVDGDTIDVNINDQTYRVRYIGMNTPESNEPCGSDATNANVSLVSEQTVTLVKDISETDRFDRLLRYVYVGDIFVNAELVAQGYAESAKYPPDVAFAEFFENLQTQAAADNVGCWPTGVFDNAGDDSESDEPADSIIVGGGTTCPNNEACIAGNINPDGEKIYHLPSCPSYSRTIIDESKGEQWFTTTADAENAGWRIAGNC